MHKNAIFLTAILMVCSACQPAPAAATVTIAATPAAVATMPAETSAALLSFPSARTGEGVAVEPGIYRIPSWYKIHMTIRVPKGWRAIQLAPENVFALVKGTNSLGIASSWIAFMPIYDEKAESFFDDFKFSPELKLLSAPKEITLGGLFPATQLDMLALPNPDYAGDPQEGIPAGTQILTVLNTYTTPEDSLDFVWTTSSPEARIRIFKIEIGDQVGIICIEAPQADFDLFLLDADAVLATMMPLQ